MNGYPDGCSQADHDRAFGESLGDPPDPDVVRLDCGHYDTEDRGEKLGPDLVCISCYDKYERIHLEFVGLREAERILKCSA